MHQSGACQAGREHGGIWLLQLHSCHVVQNVFCTQFFCNFLGYDIGTLRSPAGGASASAQSPACSAAPSS